MRVNETRPWYRHLWPWLLMLPPVFAVVGGGITLYLAVTRPDVLISKDCVKDGVTMRCGDDGTRANDTAARGAEQPSP